MDDAQDNPPGEAVAASLGLRQRLLSLRALLVLLVLVPAMVVLVYTALIASPRYESRADFMVRGLEQEMQPTGGLAQLVGATPVSAVHRETIAVRDYLLSLQAIDDLKAQGVDVEAILHGDTADWWTSLRYADRRAEGLRDYYRAMVDIAYDENSGVVHVSARAYSPEDARRLAAALIALGEGRVNTFNERIVAAGEELASNRLAEAELSLVSIQSRLTDYRELAGEIDPAASGRAAQQEIEGVKVQLALARSRLQTMRRQLAEDSPLVVAARSRVDALQGASSQLQSQITGTNGALNRRLGEFETLRLQQELAMKRFEEAQAQLDEARSQAARQQLFFVSVVSPGMPEKAVAPRPLRDTLVVLIGLALAFAIGWLLVAGVREHAAD